MRGDQRARRVLAVQRADRRHHEPDGEDQRERAERPDARVAQDLQPPLARDVRAEAVDDVGQPVFVQRAGDQQRRGDGEQRGGQRRKHQVAGHAHARRDPTDQQPDEREERRRPIERRLRGRGHR